MPTNGSIAGSFAREIIFFKKIIIFKNGYQSDESRI
jgi:hypothetical protein